MLRILFLIFSGGVLLLYLTSAWLGWEFAHSGRRSMFTMPFIGGYRGGK